MRAFAALMLALLDTPGHGQQPLQISGKFGFLGEYELSATVTPDTVGSKQKFAGPMTVRHVGLGTHNGPNESRGEITLQVTDARTQIDATLTFAAGLSEPEPLMLNREAQLPSWISS